MNKKDNNNFSKLDWIKPIITSIDTNSTKNGLAAGSESSSSVPGGAS